MKIEKTIEVVKCDFCETTDDDDNIQKCDICGKDYCSDCGTMFAPDNYHATVDNIHICKKCYKKVFKKDLFKKSMHDITLVESVEDCFFEKKKG